VRRLQFAAQILVFALMEVTATSSNVK